MSMYGRQVYGPFTHDPVSHWTDPFANFQLATHTTTPFTVNDWNWQVTPEAHVFQADPFANFHVATHTTTPFTVSDWNWKVTPEAHVLLADLGGLRGDEVKVDVEEGGVLRVTGERKIEMEERTDTWRHVERSRGRFVRRFRLPDDARVDKIKARIENGVLTVTVPKAELVTGNIKPIYYY